MKKIVLTLVAMMSMTMAFAGNTNAKIGRASCRERV